MNVIYAASGTSGNGVGNFNFKINDAGDDSEEATITVNVSPPGVPNVLCIAKSADVEIQFDIPMADPAGKHDQFTVTVDGSPATISAASLKTGDVYTIVLSLATSLTGTETVYVAYTQGNVQGSTGGYLFSFTDELMTLAAQTINFSQSLDKKYSDSPFTITATTSSGLSLTYHSSNTSVATFTGSKLYFHALGTSLITLNQTGNSTFAPARYTKTLTVSKGDQTITFNPLPAKTVGDADFSPGATASSGLTVSYTSSNTSGATIISGMIHIVGAGTSVITALQGGNTYYNAATPVLQTLYVNNPSEKTLNLTILLEGLYDGNGGMIKVQTSDDGESSYDKFPGTITDTLTVKIAQVNDPYSVIYSAYGVPVNTDGTISIGTIPGSLMDNYYIIINHRNHIETWSQTVSFSEAIINYNFTDAVSKAWGNNMILTGSYYCIYTGDVNYDEYVDGSDIVIVFNLNKKGSFGYQVSDINGDGFIDASDLVKVFNNNKKGIGMNTPVAPL